MLLVDGHNLIPALPGWQLGEPDIETRLIELLQLYARVRRRKVEVFFDGAPPGYAGERTYGTIRARFVQQGKTADDAILHALARMGKAARNASVVSADRQVQAEARARGAVVIPSAVFARELLDLRAGLDHQAAKARGRRAKPVPAEAPPDPGSQPAAGALDQWYELFGLDSDQAEKPISLEKPAPRGQKPAGKQLGKSGDRSRKRHGFPKKKSE